MSSSLERVRAVRSEVWVGGPAAAEPRLVHASTDLHLEAPNWALDGSALYLNGHGRLWRLDLAAPAGAPVAVDYDGLPEINNDHVLDPDGRHILLSAMDGHVYRGLLTGGRVERVTPDDGAWHFLHGVSPDGRRLAYVEIAGAGGAVAGPGRLAILALPAPGGAAGAPVVVDTGPGHLDGPEWSPDGRWLYVNTEAFTATPGHAQLARLADEWGSSGDGGGDGRDVVRRAVLERLVVSETVDWFPHLSPDGRHATYVAFPPGTQGHPAGLDVEVRVVATADWSRPVQRYRVRGGQGTLNVASWSPDSTHFAFVAYPSRDPAS